MCRAGHGSKRPREMKLLSPTSCSAQYLVVHRGSDQVPGEVQFTPLHLALCFLKLNKKKKLKTENEKIGKVNNETPCGLSRTY